jgi:hypothetical protein
VRNDPASSNEAAIVSKFTTAQSEAHRLRIEARTLGRTLAEGDVIDPLLDKKYRDLVTQRDRAIHEVGRLVLEWSRLGGIVSLDRVVSKETPQAAQLRVVEPQRSEATPQTVTPPARVAPPVPLAVVGFDPDTTGSRREGLPMPKPPATPSASTPTSAPPAPPAPPKSDPVSAEIARLKSENEKLRLAKEAREKRVETAPAKAPVTVAPVKAAAKAPEAVKPPAKPLDVTALVGFGHAGFVKPPPFSAADLFRSLPPPEPVKDKDAFNDAMRLLGTAVETADANWPSLSPELQRQSISYCASYARYLQDASVVLGRPLTAIEIPRVFSTLTAYTRDHRPGFSRGLARDVIPQTETWLNDARQWWAYLHGEEPQKLPVAPLTAKPVAPPVKVAAAPVQAPVPKTVLRPAAPAPVPAPVVTPSVPEKLNPEKALSHLQEVLLEDDAVKIVEATLDAVDAGVGQQDPRLVRLLLGHADTVGHPRLRVLRKAIREAWGEMTGTGDAPESEDEPEVEWKHIGLTKGKHVVLLGADDRQNTRDTIRETFQFGVLDWPPTANNRTEAVAARVRSGTVDMVILLAKFCSHSWQEKVQPACKAKGIPFVVVSNGYGTSAIRRGIEAALGLKE